jgi:predicted ATP-grasp superfamily ATP-dependent carboligase
MGMSKNRPGPTGRTTTKILIHEWVTGGGLAGRPLPASWADEGHAMRRAIARDFAALPGVRVVVTLDDRFPEEPGPWSAVRIGAGQEDAAFPRLAAEADYTVLIAPETDGILAGRARTIARVGGRSLGSTPEAIEAAADKLRLGRHLADRGIRTPACLRVSPKAGLPLQFTYPAVLKPIDGAGSQDTYLIGKAGDCPAEARELLVALLQPWIPGVVMSASFLVRPRGGARLIAAGRQHMVVRHGRFVYLGGTIPVPACGAEEATRRAVESVAGLCGFVGVDYVWDEGEKRASVLEINPRPTTSYVGLTKLYAPGALARAWLRAVSGAEPPGRLDASGLSRRRGRRKPVTFAADGGMMEPDEGVIP